AVVCAAAGPCGGGVHRTAFRVGQAPGVVPVRAGKVGARCHRCRRGGQGQGGAARAPRKAGGGGGEGGWGGSVARPERGGRGGGGGGWGGGGWWWWTTASPGAGWGTCCGQCSMTRGGSGFCCWPGRWVSGGTGSPRNPLRPWRACWAKLTRSAWTRRSPGNYR